MAQSQDSRISWQNSEQGSTATWIHDDDKPYLTERVFLAMLVSPDVLLCCIGLRSLAA